jgi:hypothetical protein
VVLTEIEEMHVESTSEYRPSSFGNFNWFPFTPSDCLLRSFNSCTINTIFRKIKYFQTLTKRSRNILTIAGRDICIVGSKKLL